MTGRNKSFLLRLLWTLLISTSYHSVELYGDEEDSRPLDLPNGGYDIFDASGHCLGQRIPNTHGGHDYFDELGVFVGSSHFTTGNEKDFFDTAGHLVISSTVDDFGNIVEIRAGGLVDLGLYQCDFGGIKQ